MAISSRLSESVQFTLPGRKQLTWRPDSRLAIIDGVVYHVGEFPADNGRGFRFRKLSTGESYLVFVANGQECLDNSCDCKGRVAHGHCKHVDSAIIIADFGIVGHA